MTTQSGQRTSRRARRPVHRNITRSVDGSHDHWNEFLENQGSPSDPRLCQVLTNYGLGLKKDAEGENATRLAGFPWVTPVLGSGCLGQPDQTQFAALLEVPARLGATVRDRQLPGGVPQEGLVYEFAKSLLEQRVQELSQQPFTPVGGDHTPTADEEAVAHCLAAAALVRRAWHQAAAISDGIVRRRDTMSLRLDDPRSEEVEVGLLEPAAANLRTVLDLLGRPASQLSSMRSVISRLSQRVQNQLRREAPRLTGHDVDGLVEVAWLMLITPQGLYPGWRDFMTATALQSSLQRQSDAAGRLIDFTRPRPTLSDVNEAAKLAASMASLKAATAYSWGVGRGTSARPTFYDAVAELLSAQLSYGDDGSPTPAAFVTSMDLELEMALVRRHERFTVLMPYHFLYAPKYTLDQRAVLFWLAATVDATQVEMGDEFDWAKLDIQWSLAPDMVTRSIDGIVVVRLVGSPLMPQASSSTPLHDRAKGKAVRGRTVLNRMKTRAAESANTDDKGFDKTFGNQDLLPAFMLDEYSGMHQMAAAVQGSLATNLVDLEVDTIYRFWLAVGVQMDDVMVRLLVASHVDTSTGPRAMLDHHGVMVNQYVSEGEVDLLFWQGFDAVQAGFERVSDDLLHYAAHLRYRAPDRPEPQEGIVPLPPSRDPELTFAPRRECTVGQEPA